MADIELVIKIPEELKRALDNNEEYRLYTESVGHAMLTAIKNGTPLPEHDGRLLILDEKRVKANSIRLNWSCQEWISEVGISESIVTIIPAMKEGD